jgi:hypothetical protein
MNDLQILLISILGTLLVLLAVWLIAVRRDPARNAAKFFGIELDLSTPGLVVLVAGCGLLALPAFVPHRPGGLPTFRSSDGELPSGDDSGSMVLRQETVLTSELEPNESVGSANVIEPGQTIKGTLVQSESTVDYFALPSAPEARGPKRVIVRTRGTAEGCCVSLTVWNEKEEQIAWGYDTIGRTISVPAPPAAKYLVRLLTDSEDYVAVNYELVVVEEQ